MLRFKTKPFAHQLEALKFGLEKKTWGAFLEMGLGKTKVAIDWIVNAGLKKVAVIGRLDDALTWKDEIKTHSDLKCIHVTKHQGKKKRLKRLGRKTRVYLLSYDSVKQLQSELLKIPWDGVVLDECTQIKHHNTKRTKAILKVFGDVPHRMAMTGAPITNSPMDIFSQMHFIDGGKSFGKSFWVFRKSYFFQAGYDWIPFKGTFNRIRERIQRWSIRKLKKNCLDLPPKVYVTRKCHLSPLQLKIYTKLKEEFELLLQDGSVVELLYVIQLFTLMLEVTGGFYYRPMKNAQVLKGGKLLALEETLDSPELRMKPKIVCWASYNQEIRMIRRIAKRLGYKYVTYWKHTKDREFTRRKFRDDPKCQLFIGQIRAGVGMNELKVADTVIYYSRSLKLSDRLQSEDRTHRAGSQIHKKITYIDLVVEGTVDEKVHKLLKVYKNVAKEILDPQKIQSLL